MSFESTSPLKGLWKAVVVSLLLSLNAGCGTGRQRNGQTVSGTVDVEGKALQQGLIRFLPKPGTSGPGVMASIKDGKFQFTEDDGLASGLHRVEIEATGHLTFEIDDEVSYALAVQKTGRSPVASNPIPVRYNRNSTLTVQVANAKDQTFDFHLTAEP